MYVRSILWLTTALCLAFASPAFAQYNSPNGQYTQVYPGTCKDTVVTLPAATSTAALAATNLSTGSLAVPYRSVTLMNVGVNPLTFVEGAGPAVVSAGFALAAAASAGSQGGSYNYPTPPVNAIQAISTLGTTLVVKTCV